MPQPENNTNNTADLNSVNGNNVNQNTNQNQNQNNNQNSQNSNTNQNNQQATDWRSSLPEDIRGEGCLKLIHGETDAERFTNMAKSFVHAQKTIGMDKIVIPSEHATEEDWNQVYKKLGLPESVDKYEMKVPDSIDPKSEGIPGFKEAALKAGILPKQAEKLFGWYAETLAKNEEALTTQFRQEIETNMSNLRKEWGNAFDAKMKAAHNAAKVLGGEPFLKWLNESGIGNRPEMIKVFSGIADRFFKEDKIGGQNNQAAGALTPSEAREKYNAIMRNPQDPYFNKNHENHAARVKEVQSLFGDAFQG